MIVAHPRRSSLVLVTLLAIALAATAIATWRVWEHDDGFCAQARSLPDVTAARGGSGTPSAGLEAYAEQLDRMASVAPDAATAHAARTLATAERAVAEALQADPTNAQAVTAIAAAANPEVAAARSRLRSTVDGSCR